VNLPSPKICRRIRQLFRLIGSPNANEAANAREKLTELLSNYGLSWNDIPTIVAAADADDASGSASRAAPPSAGPTTGPEVNVLDLVLRLLELHVALSAEERMAVALWILHTHVFDRFTITPRLALLSPVRGCGKTTVLALLDLLVANAFRSDNVTPAVIYHRLDYRPYAFLLDEGDNLGLLNNGVLRAVFNSGHRRGGSIDRFVSGRPRRYPTFAPLAVAAIGMMPLPLLHRSIIVNMQRSSAQLERFDGDGAAFAASREQIAKWAATCSLARDLEMPPSLHNRAADNWRVLLAIADDLGHGEDARAAAVARSANRPDEDIGVTLLADIRTVFLMRGIDRIASSALIEALLELEDGQWGEYRGVNDDHPPRKLRQAELARMLRTFRIRPRTIRLTGAKTARGYWRSQFEQAWAAYCPAGDTATQAKGIRHLPQAKSDTTADTGSSDDR
jgi:Protein of unknown function (DUF3631)